MERSIRDLLEAADDPLEGEMPRGFDWRGMQARVRALQPRLEGIAGRAFVLDDLVQDASFFADLAVRREGPQPNGIETVFAVRFSNFRDLFTTWSSCEEERLAGPVVAGLIAEVGRAGFRFVPLEALVEAYDGRHPGFVGQSWWIRFFDYG